MLCQVLQIHTIDPQPRLIAQAVALLTKGAVLVYPTDSGYALGCRLQDKTALMRICQLRQLDTRHHFTLVCRDLSELSLYAQVDNIAFRLVKNSTPGPYTFILPATKWVPRRLMDLRRKTIGLRVPNHRIAQALLAQLVEPLMSTSLILPGQQLVEHDPQQIEERLGGQVDLIIDGGCLDPLPTTVIDLTNRVPLVVRQGAGSIEPFC